MREDATAVEISGRQAPQAVELGGRAPRHIRVLEGMRRPANWIQLIRFGVVGASGFVLNLIVYAACVHLLSIDYHIAAVIAWLVAVLNNFILNRHWTFDAAAGKTGFQAVRFFAVSLAALGINLLLLMVFVDSVGVGKVPAQALAILASTPLNFLGNKLWSFRVRLDERS